MQTVPQSLYYEYNVPYFCFLSAAGKRNTAEIGEMVLNAGILTELVEMLLSLAQLILWCFIKIYQLLKNNISHFLISRSRIE